MGHLAHLSSTLALTCCAALGSAASAQETTPAKASGLSIELSAAEDVGEACKLSFVVTNTHDSTIEQVVYETVLFDTAGQVSRLTLLDFQDLPAGRLRVRQFQFPQACSDISRVLINGAQTCSVATGEDGLCAQGLTLNSRTKMELLG
ncbi:hypothetical protein [Pseudophaeobacter sp.]|uniref:hypothetical protein n=1 Tax=Pseudophaeobacter sp. TaxID=1971739 RepID=UPI003299E653